MYSVELDFSRPGKPTDNAFIEALNGRFRPECLNVNWRRTWDFVGYGYQHGWLCIYTFQ